MNKHSVYNFRNFWWIHCLSHTHIEKTITLNDENLFHFLFMNSMVFPIFYLIEPNSYKRNVKKNVIFTLSWRSQFYFACLFGKSMCKQLLKLIATCQNCIIMLLRLFTSKTLWIENCFFFHFYNLLFFFFHWLIMKLHA